jgi:ubiquinone/menaquinone biosynthesis C-methylase UbiE
MLRKSVFKELAKYYDLIYSWKDYRKEADKIKSLIKKHKKSDGHDLLEVACGTGKHLLYLKDSFSILATDLNKAMLSMVRKNVPNVTFKQADMTSTPSNKFFPISNLAKGKIMPKFN